MTSESVTAAVDTPVPPPSLADLGLIDDCSRENKVDIKFGGSIPPHGAAGVGWDDNPPVRDQPTTMGNRFPDAYGSAYNVPVPKPIEEVDIDTGEQVRRLKIRSSKSSLGL